MILFFEGFEETVAVECLSLSHHQFTIKAIELAGERHSMAIARQVLNDRGRIYFSRTGHKFKPCKFGYSKDGGKFESNDPRMMADQESLWSIINKHPFETPMMSEWYDYIKTALASYVKALQGHEPKGLYLDDSLTPAKLDEIVCGLVKRKILTF